MTDIETALETEWDLSTCQCAESQIQRSCEPASYRELWLLGVGGLVWATWCCWMAW